jgi:hypothetical protein
LTELTIDGTTLTRKQWANIAGIPKKSLDRRLSEGWLPKEAVFGRKRVRMRSDLMSLDVQAFVNELREWLGMGALYPAASSS